MAAINLCRVKCSVTPAGSGIEWRAAHRAANATRGAHALRKLPPLFASGGASETGRLAAKIRRWATSRWRREETASTRTMSSGGAAAKAAGSGARDVSGWRDWASINQGGSIVDGEVRHFREFWWHEASR